MLCSRHSHTSVVFHNKVFVIGGLTDNGIHASENFVISYQDTLWSVTILNFTTEIPSR